MRKKILEDIERLEKLDEVILELKTFSDNGAIIIVEGKKDVESLRLLGVSGEIRHLTGQSLIEFSESLSKCNRKIIILTDWDNKGKVLAHKINSYLLSYGIVPNMYIRSKIRNLVKKRIKDIESLNNYKERLFNSLI